VAGEVDSIGELELWMTNAIAVGEVIFGKLRFAKLHA
jgi:hypothetical protein